MSRDVMTIDNTSMEFFEAAALVVHRFDAGKDPRGAMAALSVAFHHALGERPCVRCDRWTSSDFQYCADCEQCERIHLCSTCALTIVLAPGEVCFECRDHEAA